MKDQSLVWNCPYCGRFTSLRTLADHTDCEEAMYQEEIRELRRWVERA